MKVEEQVKKNDTNPCEEVLSDLPVADEQASKTSGGGPGDEGPEESITFIFGKLTTTGPTQK
ncbi:MAG TPA: hypothetical protein VF074_10105 [Pyrinomonadaceae bacterium]